MTQPRLLAVSEPDWPIDLDQTCRQLAGCGIAAEAVAASRLPEEIARRRALPGGARWRPVIFGLGRSSGQIESLLQETAPGLPLLLLEESWTSSRFSLREAGPGWPAQSHFHA